VRGQRVRLQVGRLVGLPGLREKALRRGPGQAAADHLSGGCHSTPLIDLGISWVVDLKPYRDGAWLVYWANAILPWCYQAGAWLRRN
jgi:hypothetical protein